MNEQPSLWILFIITLQNAAKTFFIFCVCGWAKMMKGPDSATLNPVDNSPVRAMTLWLPSQGHILDCEQFAVIFPQKGYMGCFNI